MEVNRENQLRKTLFNQKVTGGSPTLPLHSQVLLLNLGRRVSLVFRGIVHREARGQNYRAHLQGEGLRYHILGHGHGLASREVWMPATTPPATISAPTLPLRKASFTIGSFFSGIIWSICA